MILKENGQFQLFDINGSAVTALQTIQSGTINLHHLTNGMYLVKVIADNRAYSDCLFLQN
ncbi:T9SS type A sorting domain-containing protein [Sunxiuqinia sp. sy24]|uniref:T9SS type A sorting domain-containing protein n=1 Tax=Sunxiuqinia sp. sy24 TaxID=3461495 RepID=UPI00404606CB